MYLEKFGIIGYMISKQGECDSSSIYLSYPSSTLYVFTFSDLNNWDQNIGMFDRSVVTRTALYLGIISPGAAHHFKCQGLEEC